MIKWLVCVFLFFSQLGHSATLLILGDSLSASYGIAEEQGWVNLLSNELPNHRIVNASISGDTTGGGFARLPLLLVDIKPDYVLIALGANDGLRGHPLPLIAKNITAMIELCKKHQVQPLLFGMRIPPNYGRRYGEGFANLYGTIARQSNVPLMPFNFDEILISKNFILSDGLHPNAAAQPIIARAVRAFLNSILAPNIVAKRAPLAPGNQ